MLDFLKSKKDESGDVDIKTDLISLLEELASAEKHAKDNYEHNRESDLELAERWLEISNELRNMRQKYMKMLVKKTDDETFCFSKHTLIAMKNCDEVGNRLFVTEPEKARELYQDRIKILNWILEVNN